MSESVNPTYAAVPVPANTLDALLATCIALKTNVDSLTRQRGTSEVWAATVLELASETGNGGTPAVSVSYLRGLVDQATNLVASVGQQLGDKVNRSGDSMGGPLTLAGNPTNPNEATTKSYVDSKVGSTDWNDITNRPGAFPPKPHPHRIDDVAGLQIELDNRALLGHRHAWTDLDAPEGVVPVVGDVLTWTETGIALLPSKGGGASAGLWIGATAPLQPGVYPFWFDLNAGHLLIWVNDGDSLQWVPAAPQVLGPPGPRGNGMLNGEGPPVPGLGRDGDFYINTLDFVVYGPRLNGLWPPGVSMRNGGKAMAIAGERVQIMGFNLELS